MIAPTLAALTVLALASLFALRFIGLYGHQALALVLVFGLLWAVLGPGGLAWKGRLRTELLRAVRLSWDRRELLNAGGRAGFWGIATAACLWVFPRSTELLPIIAVLGGVGLLRVAASFDRSPSHSTPMGVCRFVTTVSSGVTRLE